jgi:hypothetical protein
MGAEQSGSFGLITDSSRLASRDRSTGREGNFEHKNRNTVKQVFKLAAGISSYAILYSITF